MIAPDFFRVVPDEHSAWDNTRAIMVTDEGFCTYQWIAMDKLLVLDFFDESAEFIDWQGFYFGSNPLPTMWANSPHATDEYWYDGAVA